MRRLAIAILVAVLAVSTAIGADACSGAHAITGTVNDDVFVTSGTYDIKGTVNGNVTASGKSDVRVFGTVNGNVIASGNAFVEVRSGGVIIGNIEANTFSPLGRRLPTQSPLSQGMRSRPPKSMVKLTDGTVRGDVIQTGNGGIRANVGTIEGNVINQGNGPTYLGNDDKDFSGKLRITGDVIHEGTGRLTISIRDLAIIEIIGNVENKGGGPGEITSTKSENAGGGLIFIGGNTCGVTINPNDVRVDGTSTESCE